jgi:hypothetical protein
MLQFDADDRITLEHAIQHPWITGELLEHDYEVKDILTKTKNFKRQSRVHKTVHCRTESKQESRSLWNKYFSEKKRDSGIMSLI